MTGELTQFEKEFLITSYNKALAGGPATLKLIARNPRGPRGLLDVYWNDLTGDSGTDGAVAGSSQNPSAGEGATTTLAILPNFVGESNRPLLSSRCNQVSLLTSTNGGFTNVANLADAGFALNEQFCLARTYAIAQGEELESKVVGFTKDQMQAQCGSVGGAMKSYVAALSIKPRDEVIRSVSSFVLDTGMSPDQLSGTAKICLSVGYRTDNLDVAIGSTLLLVVLGQPVYGELLGFHLAQGFGTTKRADLSLAWYDSALTALENGAAPVFAPGQPERVILLRAAVYQVQAPTGSAAGSSQSGGLILPVFSTGD